ncbi:hypothetical protein [Gluconobacter frateurii]|uniref:Uncharacterized protein n=1 Tax=Gluconobacter frateurii NRIC 0228 TaxID=1307946 RepID=A0ABQ0Q910_9PROT|nr:hypothetical protein [Gluconobacter frateurii]GBR09423.1 hypothetical protein AA0228_0670 [Gluconobacter frateurii NRIC 0228]GLP91967.1 hypothetical protein GCM10007868_30420 [Gluconobacter frateurii]
MCGVKSIRQLGVELAEKHGTTADYAQRAMTAYFRGLSELRTVGWCKQVRALNPIPKPSKGQSIIVDAVAYYPENLTVGDVLALKDVS